MSHCSKYSFLVVSQFRRDSYKNSNDDEDIFSSEWMKELFVKPSDPAIIIIVEVKYEAMDGISQGVGCPPQDFSL